MQIDGEPWVQPAATVTFRCILSLVYLIYPTLPCLKPRVCSILYPQRFVILTSHALQNAIMRVSARGNVTSVMWQA